MTGSILDPMTDARDQPTTPSAPPASDAPTPSDGAAARPARTRRSRKFALPEHHHEEEVVDRIEAFLEGPPVRRRRSRSHRYHRRLPIALATDQEWAGTLRYESARSSRYGRSMAILVVELTSDETTAGPDGLAIRLAEVLGREVRETDRAIRDREDRFLVLLPETGEDEAAHLASRIERGYRGHGEDILVTGEIRIEIAVPRRGADPYEAIEAAGRRLEESAAYPG
jgi:hypothetical protein